jgi:hypothetical protein
MCTDPKTSLAEAIARRDCGSVRQLMEKGLSPTGLHGEEVAPIIQAASLGDFPIVFTLLRYGANPHVKDSFGKDARAWLEEYLNTVGREFETFVRLVVR